uniref:Uncharacterized protein n=1 Tax=Chromera velia CCMP2878 TaxID=1169474 RepID=A0A0G4IDJ0_9ALVE|eukprot:Cvel_13391.t1-p1 / transcript=Cvel_13391.t1 / gene=Cvel_13391 / organism=Chromera_velia_CCMP2878 / gene_product=hypothetical protein / transcript_product=hypothetical protein / location=Cvel_scaffold912:3568-6196(-) / protein_length=493 / sequence_SO=supercontig / SO=protein_coding / is_pseudo=false
MFSGFVWSVLTVIFLQDMGVLPCDPAALVAMKQRAAAQVYVLGGTSRGSALFPPLPSVDAKKGELPMPNLSVCTILNAFFFFLSDILQKREEKKKSSSSSSAAASSSGEVADRQEEREAEGGSDEGHEKRVEGGERTAEQSESRDDSVGRDGDAGRGRGSETPLSTGGDREGEREGASSDADSDAESFVEGQRDREGEGEDEEDPLLLSLRLSETDDEASVWRPFSTLSLEGLEGEWQTKETLRKAAGRALVALEWEGTVKTIAVKHLSLFRKRVHDAVTEVEAWDVHCEKEEGEQERELRDFWMQRQIETLTNARMSSLSKKSVREEEEEASASSDAASKSIRLTNPPNSQPSDTSNVALPLLPNPVPSVPFPVQPNLLPSFHPMSLGNSFFSPTVPLMSANAAFPGWQGRGGLGMGGQPIGTQGVGQSVRPALMQSSSSSSSSSSSVLPMAAAQGQMGKNAPLFAFPPRPLGQGTYVKASFKGNNRKNKKK